MRKCLVVNRRMRCGRSTRTRRVANFKAGKRPTIAETIAHYRAHKIGLVMFTVDSEFQIGNRRIANEEICEAARENADIMLAFASIDPHKGKRMRGGGGLKLKYSQPIYLDEVAADFPDMTIIMVHPSWPWTDEALSIALHKRNVSKSWDEGGAIAGPIFLSNSKSSC